MKNTLRWGLFLAALPMAAQAVEPAKPFKPAIARVALDRSAVPGGGAVQATYTFATKGAATERLTVFVHVVRPDGAHIGADFVPALPTTSWPRAGFVREGPFPINIPANAPLGKYQIWIGLFGGNQRFELDNPDRLRGRQDYYVGDFEVKNDAATAKPVTFDWLPVDESKVRTATAQTNRWQVGAGDFTQWQVSDAHLPHRDFIEQGGRRVGQKVWYALDEDGVLHLERDVVWPSLRIIPNDTHGSLIQHYGAEAEPKITVSGQPLGALKVAQVRLDGTLTFSGAAGAIGIKRVTFPAFEKYSALDRWTLTNNSAAAVQIAVAPLALSSEKIGPYGVNEMQVSCDAPAAATLQAGQSLSFAVRFAARLRGDAAQVVDGAREEKLRRDFIAKLSQNLVLETPDAMLNRAFCFAKWRVAEAINDTRGGMMLAPGNLRYYAATWCNDNVEYAGPFFPFLGDEGGNAASLNAYRQYMRFMKPSYERIPCSVIAEGTGTWGPFDRGDAAMYAYGAARFCLANGDKTIAEELWPGIEWSLEYCRRKLTPEGVVASDKDELEGRLPAGKANLTTASLYYGALRSAADLGRALGKNEAAADYEKRAAVLAANIEKHFGATVEGFETYRYYDGNTVLRSWICMPLSMGLFQRTPGTIDALFSPRMWTSDGLASQSGDRVFWDRSTLYALRAVYQAGETAKATEFLKKYTQRRLLGDHVPYAVEAFPEGGQGHLSSESGLYCRIFTEGLFGLLPTGLNKFTCTPRLPDGWNEMALRHVKLCGGDFGLVVKRDGAKLQVQLQAKGQAPRVWSIAPGQSVEIAL